MLLHSNFDYTIRMQWRIYILFPYLYPPWPTQSYFIDTTAARRRQSRPTATTQVAECRMLLAQSEEPVRKSARLWKFFIQGSIPPSSGDYQSPPAGRVSLVYDSFNLTGRYPRFVVRHISSIICPPARVPSLDEAGPLSCVAKISEFRRNVQMSRFPFLWSTNKRRSFRKHLQKYESVEAKCRFQTGVRCSWVLAQAEGVPLFLSRNNVFSSTKMSWRCRLISMLEHYFHFD